MPEKLREQIKTLCIAYEGEVDLLDGNHFFSLPLMARARICEQRECLIDQIVSLFEAEVKE